MYWKVKSLLNQISCYFPYILRLEVESCEYKIIKDNNGEKEILFSGNAKDCIEYLERLKCEVYLFNSSIY